MRKTNLNCVMGAPDVNMGFDMIGFDTKVISRFLRTNLEKMFVDRQRLLA